MKRSAAIFAFLWAGPAFAQGPSHIRSFIEEHCLDCHEGDTAKAGLALDGLGLDLGNRKTFTAWVSVYDRVSTGEMPPGKARKPPAKQTKLFLAALADPLAATDLAHEATEGRATRRRLNRYEYENTLRDLLHAPWLEIKDLLPEDGESHRFNKVGDALDVSYVQMAQYLSTAEQALRQVIASEGRRPETKTVRYYARDMGSFTGPMKFSEFNRSPERATFPVLGFSAQPDVRAGTAPMTVGEADPKTRELEGIGVVASAYEPLQPKFNRFRAPRSGRYKLRMRAHSVWVGANGAPNGGKRRIDIADLDVVSKGHRAEPVTLYAQSSPGGLRRLGAFDVLPDPTVRELDVYLLKGESIAPDASRLFRSRPPNWHNPLATPEGIPGVAYRWLEVEGPIIDQWPTPARKLLFGDLEVKPEPEEAPAADPVASAAAATVAATVAATDQPEAKPEDKPEVKPEAKPEDKIEAKPEDKPEAPKWQTQKPDPPIEFVSDDPEGDARRLMDAFLLRAYRRPPSEADSALFFGVVKAALDAGASFTEAMISGYGAVMCSSRFVYFEEEPGPLDDMGMAARLSYFLWNSPPDENLRLAANRGELDRPEALVAQAERMLRDPRSQRFVTAFLKYWLDLRRMNDTAPDAELYPDYYLDDLLLESAEDETLAFFNELLRADLPARNLIHSNFVMVNERLAQHYDLPAVKGVALRRTRLPASSPRGGLLTQASVLKVTANGTTTSPVLRGVWIMERLLGAVVPPPPPGVPAVEPDVRGARTIREQLEKHREDKSCAGCHAKIDPAGFALESFDIFGGFRDRYRALGGTGQVTPVSGVGKNGQTFVFHDAQPVDASGTLPAGQKFRNVKDIKRLLLRDERQIARNLARQLLVFATGAPVRFGDRSRVEEILDRAAKRRYGVRTLALEIVKSDIFRRK